MHTETKYNSACSDLLNCVAYIFVATVHNYIGGLLRLLTGPCTLMTSLAYVVFL